MRVYKLITKAVNILALFVIMVCISCLDSPNYWPFIIGILVSGAWLLLVLYASTEWEP